MGKDHINSNDNGKGADIFNDVPGMIEKIIRKIETGIRDIQEHGRQYTGIQRIDMSGFDMTGIKIRQLKETVASFNTNREHKIYRTAEGGKGDPKNAEEFSKFSKKAIDEIERLCSLRLDVWEDTYALSKMRNSDWKVIVSCRNFRDSDDIKKCTVDNDAYIARKKELGSDKKLVRGFDEWYKESVILLLRAFNELTDVIEHFRQTKNIILKKRKKDVVAGSPHKLPFNNGGDRGEKNPNEEGRKKRLIEAQRKNEQDT